MNKFEKILYPTLLFVFLCNLFLRFPGINLLTIAVFGLSVIAVPVLFLTAYRDPETGFQQKGYSLMAGIGLMFINLTLLFRLLIWPGSELYGYITLAFTLLVAAYGLFRWKKESDGQSENVGFFKGMGIRTSIFALIAASLLLVFTPVRLAKIRFRTQPEYLEYLLPALENPGDEGAQRRLEEYRRSTQ